MCFYWVRLLYAAIRWVMGFTWRVPAQLKMSCVSHNKSPLLLYSLKWLSLICGLRYSKGTVVFSVQSAFTHTESETRWHDTHNHTVYAHTVVVIVWIFNTHTHTHVLPDDFFLLIFVTCLIATSKLLHHLEVCNIVSKQKFALAVFMIWLIYSKYRKEKAKNICICCFSLIFCHLSQGRLTQRQMLYRMGPLKNNLSVFSLSVSLSFNYQTISSK